MKKFLKIMKELFSVFPWELGMILFFVVALVSGNIASLTGWFGACFVCALSCFIAFGCLLLACLDSIDKGVDI
jgi:uncharacterized membrane protein